MARHARAHGPTAPVIVLPDTNVLLDVLLAREPWAADAARLTALPGSRDAGSFW